MKSEYNSALHETRLRVRYAETDQMGVVYHSNHFIWFEVGRVELMRQMGFSYRDMERDDGLFIAVAEATCRYRAPAYYDEEITRADVAEEGARLGGYFPLRTGASRNRRAAGGWRDHAHCHRCEDESVDFAGKVSQRHSAPRWGSKVKKSKVAT